MNNKGIKVNNLPRCSVSKLGEYVSSQSSPSRRREIVKSQKYPPTYKVVTYAPATRSLVGLASVAFDDDRLLEAINEFAADLDLAVTSYDRTQAKCCLDALRSFRGLSDSLANAIANCSATPGPQTWFIELAGVKVSLRPELFLDFEGKNGKRHVGFVKLYFSKTHRLDEHSAAVIGAVICEKARQVMPAATISNQHVLVVDVFAGKIYPVPAPQTRLLKEAIAACEEIALFWNRELAS